MCGAAEEGGVEGEGASKEMAGEGQDEEMGDGRGQWLVEGKGRK